MFPIPIFSHMGNGNFTLTSDLYSNMRPMIPFSNGDFSISLLPFQTMAMSSDPHLIQNSGSNHNPERATGAPSVMIRIIMSGKEVGSIIGKKGDNVKKIREQSGARVNISDGSSPERIVSVSGTVEKVFVAFLLICQKFEDDYEVIDKDISDRSVCPPVTLRLLVPATQCGSIIGKGGCKIKEIRDMCGASIQVASELLPHSSERSVTVSGTANSVAKCIKQISVILLETPVKYGTVQYRPKSAFINIPQPMPHVHNMTSLAALHPHPQDLLKPINNLSSSNIPSPIALFPMPPAMPGQFLSANMLPAFISDPLSYDNYRSSMSMLMKQPHSVSCPSTPDLQSPSFVSTTSSGSQHMTEMVIANDLIGCVIGRAGNTINEIRSMSGAQIKISDIDESTHERHIIISGLVEAVNTAQLLINSNIQSYRNSLSNSQTPKTSSSCVDGDGHIAYSNTSSSRETRPVYNFVQRYIPKYSSHHYNIDGTKKPDYTLHNPY